MATQNSAKTVTRAVMSVLSQDFWNLELLIFDAASTDSTPEILKNLAQRDGRIRLHNHEEKLPWIANAQLGLQRASGDYFMLLDADDYIAPNYLSHLIKKQRAEHSLGTIGKLLHCDKEGQFVIGHPAFGRVFEFAFATRRHVRIHRMILTPDRYGAVNLLYSLWVTSELRTIGLWSADGERIDDDYQFCLQALSKGQIATEPNTWICRSVVTSLSHDHDVRDLSSELSFKLSTSHHENICDWTYPYLIQIFRFIKDDWKNLMVIIPTLLRIGIATAALPIRILRKVCEVRD